SALETWEKHPIVGAGLGVMVSRTNHPRAVHSMEYWGTPAMAVDKTIDMEAHNIPLNILGQLGLLGLGAFTAFMGCLLRGQGGFGGTIIVSAFVGAVFYHGFFGAFEESRQLWYLFGLAWASSRSPIPPP